MSNEFIDTKQLKECIRAKYAWPGGYELIGVTEDGGLLCSTCMRTEYKLIARARRYRGSDKQWEVIGILSTGCCENGETCDHCNKSLDGYNEPEQVTVQWTVIGLENGNHEGRRWVTVALTANEAAEAYEQKFPDCTAVAVIQGNHAAEYLTNT